MSKVRINELARELEVKPNRILELLPEFGVEEKKTHSSSIDEDVAIAIKRKLVSGSDSDVASRPERESYRAVAVADDDEPEESSRQEESERPLEDRVEERATSSGRVEAPKPVEEPAAATSPEVVAEAQKAPVIPARTSPLRPPLASGPLRPPTGHQHVSPSAAPPAPPAPPVVAAASPQAPSAPVPTPAQPLPRPASPGVPQQPQQQARPAMPGRDVPIFSPKPGQATPQRPAAPAEPANRPGAEARTGPPSLPGTPRPAPSPGTPRPPIARPQLPSRPQQGQPIGGPPRPGGPQQPQGPRPSMAGQPAARPVVPPNPELLARIQQSRPGPPPAPGQPRPGPTRPNQPAPGQPIFRGPLRPGQGPRLGGPTPGAPSPGAPQQMRGRGPQRHPTSPLGRIEPAPPPPTELGRRHQAKPRPTGDMDRKRDMEGKLDGKFRPQKRQEQAPPPIDREITI
ncbi:MAG TPA: translation initiation factor IF-2 N-terminal domain-containing protein, partial [Bryobacteraceae bacterium]|nr:translation initiation factor IF-2 N-terminal domain-containing protein [Bryobacteraceae bacterium]